MKRNLLNGFLAFSLLIGASTTGKAQVVETYYQDNSFVKNFAEKNIPANLLKSLELKVSDNNYNKYAVYDRSMLMAADEANEVFNVEFELKHDGVEVHNTDLQIMNSETHKGTTMFIDNDDVKAATQLEAAKYDFIYTIRSYDNVYLLIKEQVDINADTKITFDVNDATNVYDFKQVKLNGDECVLDKGQILKDDTYQRLEKGNIDVVASVFLFCIDDDVRWISLSQESFDDVDVPMKAPSRSHIRMNDVSDRISLSLTGCFMADMNLFAFQTIADMAQPGVIKNNADNYVLYEETFKSTPYANGASGYMGLNVRAAINGLYQYHPMNGIGITVFSPLEAKDNKVSYYVDGAEQKDNYKMLTFPIFFEDDMFGTFGLPSIVSKQNGVQYVNAGHDQLNWHIFQIIEGGDYYSSVNAYPGNKAFAFTQDQKMQSYANNAPINSVCALDAVYGTAKYTYLDCTFVGRYGEVRSSDLAGLQVKATYNGEDVICEDISKINDIMNNGLREPGYYDIVYTNNNIMVDDMKGKNVTHIHNDWTLEDYTAPTLQMLWFKNNQGQITDRFETVDEAILEFAGGDFAYYTSTTGTWFNCQPQTAEVYFSAYGEEEWKTVGVQEIAENYYMPSFGYFYRGELKDADGLTEKGWYDLKVKLTDASGNYQEQIISPAFYINNSVETAIDEVNEADNTVESVYTADGIQIGEMQKGMNIVRYANGEVKKIIVK